MKKLQTVGLIAVVLFFSMASAHAQEDLTAGWTSSPFGTGSVQLTPVGTSLDFTVDATAATDFTGEILSKNFPGTMGMAATVNISQVTGANDNANLFLRQNVGSTSTGNNISAEVSVSSLQGRHSVNYRVRERDSLGTQIKVIARGFLGDADGGWTLGQDVVIAFARIGNEVWFFTPANGAMTKVALLEPMGVIESEMQIMPVADTGSAITGTVSNVIVF